MMKRILFGYCYSKLSHQLTKLTYVYAVMQTVMEYFIRSFITNIRAMKVSCNVYTVRQAVIKTVHKLQNQSYVS